MTSWGLIVKNLFRKKLRTFLTLFAIMVAFLIFGVLSAAQKALAEPDSPSAANRLVTTNFINFTQPLPISYVERVKALPNVKTVSHMSWFGGYFQEPKNFTVAFAVDPETFLAIYPELIFGEGERDAFIKDRTGIMVGKKLADQYGWKVGDRIPLKSNIFRQKSGGDAWDFVVTGIFTNAEDDAGDQYVFFHYNYFNESRSFGHDFIGQLVVEPVDVKEIDALAQAIDNLFRNSPAETETRTEAAFAATFGAQFGDVGFMVTAVVGAAFLTILLIVGNTMMLTVRERTGEIAVLKTIGFTAKRIFAMVLTESFILAIAGGVLGVGLAYVLLLVLPSQIPEMQLMPPIYITSSIVLSALGLAVLLGLITGLLPAWRAMRTDIITAFGRK